MFELFHTFKGCITYIYIYIFVLYSVQETGAYLVFSAYNSSSISLLLTIKASVFFFISMDVFNP